MSESEEKRCFCKNDSYDFQSLFGGIIVYELAVIVVLLALILINLDNTESEVPDSE